MAGEACSSTADCYNDAACLGGRCCSMSQSQYATSKSQDTASAPRAQTAPTTSPELAWPATQGIMWSRARRLTQTSTPVLLGICTATIRAATHRNTTLPNTTPVTPRQPRVVRAARRNLISAHLGCAVTIFAATKLLRTVVAHLLVILGLAPVAPGSWQARRAAALRTATTTRRALVVAAARCRSLNTQREIARYSECTACADSTHDKPGTCVACDTGYHVVTGEETDADIDTCTSRHMHGHYPCSDASQYYTTQYDTCYAKTTPGGACSSSQSYKCTSGLCSSNICCDQAAADSGCTSACDPGTGTCSTRVMAGEACSSTADCYNDAACLGGRCCSMSQSEYASEIARYSECTACADSTHDKPGTCVACDTGYHVVTGEETDADIDTCTFSAYARPTIRAATHRNTTLPNTTPVTPRQTRVVRAARRNLISAHLGCAVTIFAATKLLHR